MRRLRQPEAQTDALQIVKSVVAAVGAWWLAGQVLSLPSSFLAPWSALLTVHATVYRSLSRGVQSVVATGLGIVLAYLAVQAAGPGMISLAVTLLLALVLSRVGVLRQEGVTVATSALFVLTLGIGGQETMLLSRILDTALGVGCGVVVNLVLVPPLTHRSAEQQLDLIDRDMGRLMVDMARQMRRPWSQEESGRWIEQTRQLDDQLSVAWRLVTHARESGFWNPRRWWSSAAGDPTAYESILLRVEDGIAQLRAIARTIDQSTRLASSWDPRFRDTWLQLLAETGQRIADPEADVSEMHEQVDRLTRSLSGEDLPGLLWPLYGALISNLLNVIDVVDDVASARPARP